MVRVFLKGGVWKNSEDEVLKAGVQKYGKHSWARVASLLNRKTAKQAKARWYEWLDPSVKKVEWSREEEEKLLHLAKLMPAQWKTIAPLVGRTANQCQEHYEKLLDEAATASGAGGEEDANASLRNQALRPGQIDVHPESKPARPDPIDMDEDEIEMLQEARARLANTQGKKAKRKARERMLAEAKRLADLQKRRELKQAGLLSSQARKKARKRNRDIDLGVEIPFHKPAPAGFHDVTSEVERGERMRQKQMKSIDYKKINEQAYRSRDREEAKAKKREEARLRALEKTNMQYVVNEVSKKNDPLNIRKRGALNLPAPSVSDKELNDMAKLENAARTSAPDMGDTGTKMTSALLGDYSDRPLPTPMRTPMTSSASTGMTRQESLMREASNLRMLERGQTPLLGGENPDLHPSPDEETAEEDRKMPAKSSVLVATPGRPDRAGVGQTPATLAPRDQLGLNRPTSQLRGPSGGGDDYSVGGSTFATSSMSIRDIARQERKAAKRARQELEAALAALPAPQFEYELAAPSDAMDTDEQPVVETVMEEDMADVDRREKQRADEEAKKLYEAMSSVIKRKNLPRPVGAIQEDLESFAEDPLEQLVDNERLQMLKHDAFLFPVVAPTGSGEKKKKSTKRNQEEMTSAIPPETQLDQIPEAYLTMAKRMVEEEREQLIELNTSQIVQEGLAQDSEEAIDLMVSKTTEVRENAKVDLVYDGSSWVHPTDENEKASLKAELAALQEATSSLRKKNEKVASKLGVINGGFQKRAESLAAEAVGAFLERQNAIIEESVYKKLQDSEQLGGARRIDALRSDIAALNQDAGRLNQIYHGMMQKAKSA